MNNTTGIKAFFNNSKGHVTVAKCLDHEKPSVMVQALKVNPREEFRGGLEKLMFKLFLDLSSDVFLRRRTRRRRLEEGLIGHN